MECSVDWLIISSLMLVSLHKLFSTDDKYLRLGNIYSRGI